MKVQNEKKTIFKIQILKHAVYLINIMMVHPNFGVVNVEPLNTTPFSCSKIQNYTVS